MIVAEVEHLAPIFLRKVRRETAHEIAVITAFAEVLSEDEVLRQIQDEELRGVHHDEILGVGMRNTSVFQQLPPWNTHQLDGHATSIPDTVPQYQSVATGVANPRFIFTGIRKDALAVFR